MSIKFQSDTILSDKELVVMKHMTQFYTPERLRDIILPVVDRKTQASRVSLRCIEWLVVNYSKTFPILLPHPSKDSHMTSIYTAYKTWLWRYRRTLFDPFRRRHRVCFKLDDVTYSTTLGQLNFMYWAHRYGVLEYARVHQEAIENHHANVLKEKKQKNNARRVTHTTGQNVAVCCARTFLQYTRK